MGNETPVNDNKLKKQDTFCPATRKGKCWHTWGAYRQPNAPTISPPNTKPPTKPLPLLGLPPSPLF